EFRGTTILQRQTAYNPTYNIVSQQNPLPPPVLVPMSDLLAPVYDPVAEGWFVENHDAELYESMRIIVRDITVGTMNLGKDADNYHVENPAEDSCWASDYMNEDVVGLYHPFVVSGQHFCALAGVFEQFTRLSTGFDYYQVLPQASADLAICGDGDSDGEIALTDVPRFGECMTGPVCDDEPEGCDPPAWTSPPVNLDIQHCLMMDLDYDGDVDLGDFSALQAAWPVP
ncbi:MAG: hypothetical protein GY842_28415, partial [bacterium]|nr:hypothetical protein [bacterium]